MFKPATTESKPRRDVGGEAGKIRIKTIFSRDLLE